MDDLEKVHAKEEIKKWKRSLSEKDWQEYKKKVRLRKETEHRIQRITKRIDKAINNKNRISVEEEKEKLEVIFTNRLLATAGKITIFNMIKIIFFFYM